MNPLTEEELIEQAWKLLPLPSEHPEPIIKIRVMPQPIHISFGMISSVVMPSGIVLAFHKQEIKGVVIGWEWREVSFEFNHLEN